MKGGVCMLDRNELRRLQNADIMACEPDRLTDISNLQINANQRTIDKMSSFIDRVGNPYLFKVGKTVVKVEYEGNQGFADAFASLIRAG